MAAYAYYKAGKTPEAIASAERYTTMHPGTKDAALAHHIIASAYFDEMKRPEPRPDAHAQGAGAAQDPEDALSRQHLRQGGRQPHPHLPRTRSRPRRWRSAATTSSKKNQIGAINRFKTVVADYQTTAHVEEALMRLTESYMALGIEHEAQTAAAVLGHNFPNSRWYKDAYALLQSDGLRPREDGEFVDHQGLEGGAEVLARRRRPRAERSLNSTVPP